VEEVMTVQPLDQFNFHHVLADTAGVSLIYFTASACGACKQLKWMFDHHPDEFALLSLFEVDAQREMALTHEFGVFHLPALFLFNEGEFHAEIQAEPLPHAIIAAVEAALAQPAKEAP
jgi:thioredoxin-like negative regulator of GroEL